MKPCHILTPPLKIVFLSTLLPLPLCLGNSHLSALSLFDVSSSYSHQGQGQVLNFLSVATLVTLPCHPQPVPIPSLPPPPLCLLILNLSLLYFSEREKESKSLLPFAARSVCRMLRVYMDVIFGQIKSCQDK